MKKEVMPMGCNVMVELYAENPYEEKETEDGLKLTNGEFDNPDTGNRDKKDQSVFAASIIEVGPETKYAKPGDDCLFPLYCAKPLPFNGHLYFIVAEPNILAVMADDINTRLK